MEKKVFMRLWLKTQTVFQVVYACECTIKIQLIMCVCVCVTFYHKYIHTGRPESFRIQAMNYFNDTVSFGNNTPHWRDMKKSLLTSLKMWEKLIQIFWNSPVADPGFPRRRTSTPKGEGANLLFGQISPKPDYMKMKKIWPEGGGGVRQNFTM